MQPIDVTDTPLSESESKTKPSLADKVARTLYEDSQFNPTHDAASSILFYNDPGHQFIRIWSSGTQYKGAC